MRKSFFSSAAAMLLFAALKATALDVSLSYSGAKSYALVERTNLRMYENGKYVGPISREVHSVISPSAARDSSPRYAKDSWFDGNFYVTEERKNNETSAVDGIYDSIPSVFHIAPNGELTMFEDNGFPTFRSFPAFPAQKVGIGDSWTATAERAVDPKNDGTITRLKIEVRYTLAGEATVDGEAVWKIDAIWQTLYGMSWRDKSGDPNLTKARGGHKAEIMVRKSTGEPVLVMDNVDETFSYRDGTEISYRGTIALFTKYPPSIDHGSIIAAMGDIATVKPSGEAGDGEKKRGSKPLGGGSAGSITTASGAKGDGGTSDTEGGNGSGDGKKAKKGGSAEKDGASPDKSGAESGGAGKRASARGKSGADAAASGKSEKNGRNPSAERGSSSSGGKTASSSGGRGAGGASESGADTARRGVPPRATAGNRASGDAIPAGLTVQMTAAKNDMIVQETDAGIKLTIQNLQFQADSANLVLGTEGSRLDDIARVLKLAGESKILIEGHTAAVGKPAGELSLSQERARKIANELVARGIPAERIIVRGWGGAKPLAPNTTNAGRELNRRVEITILQ